MNLSAHYSDQDRRFARAFDLLRHAIAAHAFPGCSLAVLHGELIAFRGLGRFTYEPASPEVIAATVFDVASLTKVVATTSMAMILYERGLLDLELPVQSVVREFAGSTDTRRRQVTFRSLLAHTSGLPAYVRLFEAAKTRDELVLAACRTPLEAGPGERTQYSDIGFIVLGEALARLADEPLDSFCRRELFGPLAMANTCFCPPQPLRPAIPPTENDQTFRRRLIQGEVNDENAYVMGGVAGHAGLFSNAFDLAQFASAVLDGVARPPSAGKLGQPLFRRETIGVFSGPQTAHSGSPRALGFDLPSTPSQSGRYFSPRSLGHLGFTGTSLWMDPDRHLAIILLTNRTWPDRRSQEIKRVRPLVHDAIVEAL